ncbi:MAG: TonB-dependent receptor [Parvibaculales bacterium]
MSKFINRALTSAAILYIATQPALSQSPASSQSEETEVDEVIVLSSPSLKPVSEIISVTHVIDDEAIAANPGGTIGNLIADLPGVDSASHGPAVGRPVIRGQGGYRVGTLENGLGVSDVSSTGNDHANALNLFEQGRVEVLKGPSALRYGTYANTGVVNSFNRHFDADAGDETRLAIGGSSVADEEYYALFARRGYDGISLAISAFDRDADNIRIPTHAESTYELIEEGEEIVDVSQDAANTSSEADGVTVSARFDAPGSQLTIMGTSLEMGYGLPGHAHGGAVEELTIGMQRDSVRALLNHDLNGMFKRLEAQVHHSNFNQDEFDEGTPETSFGQDVSEVKLDLFNAPTGRGWEGLVGLSWKDAELATSGDEAFLPSTDEDMVSAYVIQSRESGAWVTELAARFDDVTLKSGGQEKGFDLLNLAAGTGYRLDANALLGVSVALTERAPSVSELFADGVHAAASRYERGNANLGTEESIASEIYYRRSFGNSNIQLTAFQNDYDDFIYLKSAGTQLENQDVFDYTPNDAEFTGFELSAETTGNWSGGNWTAGLTYATLEGELSDGTPLRSIPPEKIGLHGGLTGGNLSLGLDVLHADDQTDVPAGQFQTDGYTEVNAELNWSPEGLNGGRITLSVENLLDEEIRRHTSAVKDLLPEAGRNVRLMTTLRF